MNCRRVELVSMDDAHAPSAGTLGTVRRIGALGDLEVDWDDGSRLHLIPGIDSWREKLRVVFVEPGVPAREAHIDNDLQSCQSIVRGCMTVVCPFDDPVLLVANDNAVAEGHAPNRVVCGTIIPGPFFICGEDDEGDFCSLTPELAHKYQERFAIPDAFATTRLRVKTTSVCPSCGRPLTRHPALSREDNHTPICPRCGAKEALDAAGLPAIIVQRILLDLDRQEQE